METIISKNIDLAIDLLLKEEIVAFPTETVYGLGASVFSEKALKKVFLSKKRPQDNPLIAHVDSLDLARKLVDEFPPLFLKLIEKFWPGPLTLILPKKKSLSDLLTAKLETVAIRMPAHPVALAIIKGVKLPIAAPSANLSGRPSPTTAQDVKEDFNGILPLIIDGGACQFGMESTVLNLTGPKPELLRLGAISKETLEETIKEKILFQEKPEKILCPGMSYRHYAPKAKLRLVFDLHKVQGPFVLSREKIEGVSFLLFSSATFYTTLRELDRRGVLEAEVYCDPKMCLDLTLMDRVQRASQ